MYLLEVYYLTIMNEVQCFVGSFISEDCHKETFLSVTITMKDFSEEEHKILNLRLNPGRPILSTVFVTIMKSFWKNIL